MKRYFVAAGALLLSTSALAWAPDQVDSDADSGKFVTSAEEAVFDAKGFDTFAKSADMDGDAKLETAAWSDFDKSSGEAALQTAALNDFTGKKPFDGTVETAFYDDWPAAKESAAAMQDVDGKADTGMGGPLEEADASLTPRVGAENYPPCDPGPGDDRCIQLYEPGVRTALASWNEPTGGLADGSATTAMGGPYEPIEDETAHLAMNGDGLVDAATGESAEIELAGAQPVGDVAAHSDFTGVGGPVEAQSGYPPCSPGPGDDRCIQLYEQGVTGAGN